MTAAGAVSDGILASSSTRKIEERSASNGPISGQAEMALGSARDVFQGLICACGPCRALRGRCEPCSGSMCRGHLVHFC
jgi:hypothetical protein